MTMTANDAMVCVYDQSPTLFDPEFGPFSADHCLDIEQLSIQFALENERLRALIKHIFPSKPDPNDEAISHATSIGANSKANRTNGGYAGDEIDRFVLLQAAVVEAALQWKGNADRPSFIDDDLVSRFLAVNNISNREKS